LFGLIILPFVASAETVTLQSVAVVELREGTPTNNFGTGTTMVSGGLGITAGNETRRSLIRFDPAAAIPSGSIVLSATLTVVVAHAPLTPVSSTFGLRRII
jgi:hypothetical protein